MILYTYSDERRSVKYWKKVTFHIMYRMVVNSYLLNTENDKQTLRLPQANVTNTIHSANRKYLDKIG